ncbi:MAG: FAD-binding oxidoreductase [bacterium]
MREALSWLRDLSRYVGFGLERVVRPRLGQGVDYREPRFRDQARLVVERLHPRRMSLRVDAILQETPTTRTFRFVRTDGALPPFRAGQYVNLYVEIAGVRTSRPYSISSAPGSDHLDLTVRDNPGGFVASYLLEHLAEGDVVETSGPAGSFYYEPLIHREELVFLAGGSGITPFMSMLRDQARRGWPLRIQLLYGSRSPDDVLFADELAALAESTDRFSWCSVISEPPPGYDGPTGLLDAPRLRDALGVPGGRMFFVCGPNRMYDLCLRSLEELAVPPHRVRRELYGPPSDVTAEPGWPESVDAGTTFRVDVLGVRVFDARAGEPLLNAFERHHVVAPALCRSGECSACRTRILAGQVFMPAGTGVRESDARYGYVHACVAYPISDLKIRL